MEEAARSRGVGVSISMEEGEGVRQGAPRLDREGGEQEVGEEEGRPRGNKSQRPHSRGSRSIVEHSLQGEQGLVRALSHHPQDSPWMSPPSGPQVCPARDP